MAGLRDILIITGRGKHAIEDHFDRNFELEHYLEQSGKLDQLDDVKVVNDIADIHYIRQRDPLGLGHAVNVAREHVGDEPFAVLLGDDIMVDDARLLESMLDVYEREHASVLGAARGHAGGDRVARMCRGRHGQRVARSGAVARREAEAGGGAVEPRGDRSLRVHAVDLRRARSDRAGRERRVPAHRRDRAPARVGTGLRADLLRGSLRHRQGHGVPPGQHRARARARRPRARPRASTWSSSCGSGGSRDRVRRGPRPASSPRSIASSRWSCRRATRSGSCSRPTSRPPVRSLRSPTPRWTGTRCAPQSTVGATADAPVRLQVVGELPAGHAPTIPVGDGEAIRIMTGAPMPDGADAIVIVELTERDGVDGVLVQQEAPRRRSRAPGGWRRRAR